VSQDPEINFSGMPNSDDFVLPFQIESLQIRGRLVRLSTVADTIVRQHAYPPPIARLVGESLAVTAALAQALKFDGIFTLQTKTDGAVSFLVSDMTSAGHLRSYCSYDAEAMAALLAENSGELSLPRLMGQGYLALTVDQGEHTERYQGIVELTGRTLVDCVAHYFQQSEQLETAIKVATAQAPSLGGREHWRAGAIMLQRLPLEGGSGIRLDREEQEDGWRRLMYLLGTCTDAELTDPYLTAQDLLYRLFNEDGVRVFPPLPMVHRCRCSRERIELVLSGLAFQELQEMQIDGRLEVRCQFCNNNEVFLLTDFIKPEISNP
jgi:molecular chaperone Hsp33